MAEFKLLSPRLAAHWEKPFDKLPDDLKDAVREALPFTSWDGLNVYGRQNQIGSHDYQHDPATEAARELDFNLRSRIGDLERERRELELMRATSPLERESQKRQFAEVDAEIAAIEKQLLAPTTTDETKKQRSARLLKRLKELRAAGSTSPTKTLAAEFGISGSLVRRIIRNSKPEKKPKPGSIASVLKRK